MSLSAVGTSYRNSRRANCAPGRVFTSSRTGGRYIDPPINTAVRLGNGGKILFAIERCDAHAEGVDDKIPAVIGLREVSHHLHAHFFTIAQIAVPKQINSLRLK